MELWFLSSSPLLESNYRRWKKRRRRKERARGQKERGDKRERKKGRRKGERIRPFWRVLQRSSIKTENRSSISVARKSSISFGARAGDTLFLRGLDLSSFMLIKARGSNCSPICRKWRKIWHRYGTYFSDTVLTILKYHWRIRPYFVDEYLAFI